MHASVGFVRPFPFFFFLAATGSPFFFSAMARPPRRRPVYPPDFVPISVPADGGTVDGAAGAHRLPHPLLPAWPLCWCASPSATVWFFPNFCSSCQSVRLFFFWYYSLLMGRPPHLVVSISLLFFLIAVFIIFFGNR
jgi:hypothetical protein